MGEFLFTDYSDTSPEELIQETLVKEQYENRPASELEERNPETNWDKFITKEYQTFNMKLNFRNYDNIYENENKSPIVTHFIEKILIILKKIVNKVMNETSKFLIVIS